MAVRTDPHLRRRSGCHRSGCGSRHSLLSIAAPWAVSVPTAPHAGSRAIACNVLPMYMIFIYIDKLHLCFHVFSIKLRVGESSLFPALALDASFALERQCRLTK